MSGQSRVATKLTRKETEKLGAKRSKVFTVDVDNNYNAFSGIQYHTPVS